MTDPIYTVLHVGAGPGLTLLEYLLRVSLHLLAICGVAVLALRWPDAIGAVRATISRRRDGEGRDV